MFEYLNTSINAYLKETGCRLIGYTSVLNAAFSASFFIEIFNIFYGSCHLIGR